MKWNRKKFQLLRVGSNNFLHENIIYFSLEHENIIPSCEYVKDLGLFIDKDLSFKHQRCVALGKVWKKLGWVKKTFHCRSTYILRTLWNSLLQPHLDYGSVLTAPMTIGQRKECEKPLKTFTKLSWECRELNYWQRLKHFKLLSNERRMER